MGPFYRPADTPCDSDRQAAERVPAGVMIRDESAVRQVVESPHDPVQVCGRQDARAIYVRREMSS